MASLAVPKIFPICIQDVSMKSGSAWLLRDITLRIHAGECLVVIGHNGAGKSTLLKMIAGLLKPTEGQIQWADNLLCRDARLVMAMAFQHPRFLQRRVMQVLHHALSPLKLSPQESSQRIARALRDTELEQHVDKQITNLSGGESRRLALARVLIRQAKLVLLDEPFAHLDSVQAQNTFNIINKMKRLTNSSLVLVSHGYDKSTALADRVICLESGRITFEGSQEAFQNRTAR